MRTSVEKRLEVKNSKDVSLGKENWTLSKAVGVFQSIYELEIKTLSNMGEMSAKIRVQKALEVCPPRHLKIRRQPTSMLGKKNYLLGYFSGVEHMELERELFFSVISFLDEVMLGRKVVIKKVIPPNTSI